MIDNESTDGGNQSGRLFAISLVVMGLLLIGAGALLISMHEPPSEPLHVARSRIPPTIPAARGFQHGVLLLAIVVAAFAVITAAFLRWSRHFRKQLLHRPAPPTPVVDAWAMHRLPEEDEPPGDAPSSGPEEK